METLIVFDNEGKIYYQSAADKRKPEGLPYLVVNVPEGKYAKCVDVTDSNNPVLVLEDKPISREEQRLRDLEDAIEALVLDREE